jgi:hypothetical protein
LGYKPLILVGLAVALVVAGVAFLVATAEADLEIEHGMVILLVVFVILPLVAIWLAIKAWRMADRPGGALVAGLIVIAAFLPAPIALAGVVYEPAGPPEGVAVGDVFGPWMVSGTETLIFYEGDGTYTMSSVSDFGETVFEQGGYEVAGNILTHISSEASNTCAVGQTGRYEIEVLNNQKWRLHLLDDECTPRSEGSPFTLVEGLEPAGR